MTNWNPRRSRFNTPKGQTRHDRAIAREEHRRSHRDDRRYLDTTTLPIPKPDDSPEVIDWCEPLAPEFHPPRR